MAHTWVPLSRSSAENNGLETHEKQGKKWLARLAVKYVYELTLDFTGAVNPPLLFTTASSRGNIRPRATLFPTLHCGIKYNLQY